MIRNLKPLGLTLASILAMSALVASVASAQTNGELTSSTGGEVTLISKNTNGKNAFTMFGSSEVECPNAINTGHEFHITPHQLIPSGSSTFTVTSHYGACVADGFPATVDMNGCDRVLHIRETGGGGSNKYGSLTTTVCPPGQNVQVTVFTGSSHAIRVCAVTFTENAAGYPGLQLVDLTNGILELEGTATELEAHRAGFGCATETDKEAKIDLDISIEGRNNKGQTVPISISH